MFKPWEKIRPLNFCPFLIRGVENAPSPTQKKRTDEILDEEVAEIR